MKVMVTGGAGFIGSHIVDELVRRGNSVIVYDNLSTGYLRHIQPTFSSGKVTFIQGEILDLQSLVLAMKGISRVFHLAANADVRGGIDDTNIDLEQNTIGTYKVLEAMRQCGANEIVFTSSATIYGEPDVFPTPENYASLQTSLYGASKLSAEALIQAYSEYFGMRSYIFRFVSWIGERYSHGVIFDFVDKLRKNPSELHILGDGNQTKSYLHVEDGIRGIFMAIENFRSLKNIVNLGHSDFMKVTELARIICRSMGLMEVKLIFSGGVRGWLGDSPRVHLDISKLRSVGFIPQISIEQGVERTTRYLLDNPWLLEARI
jgi:UDP-glucose 4-epimerase